MGLTDQWVDQTHVAVRFLAGVPHEQVSVMENVTWQSVSTFNIITGSMPPD